jgi:hypothetical protein
LKSIKRLSIIIFSLTLLTDAYSSPESTIFDSGISYSPLILNLRGEGLENLPQLYAGPGKVWLGEDLSGYWILQGIDGYVRFVGNLVIGAEIHAGKKNFTATANDTSLFADTQLTALGAYLEWGVPAGRRFEVLVGTGAGLNRMILHYSMVKTVSSWDNLFNPAMSPMTMTSLNSGFHFYIRPYISLKYRIMDKLGFKIATSMMIAQYPQSGWTLNGHVPLGDGKEIRLMSPGFHLGLILGL